MQARIEYSNLPKLIILTGPQGSGNHLFSKVLALNPAVHGWQDLLDEYWIGHDQEPFAKYWADPKQLDKFDALTHAQHILQERTRADEREEKRDKMKYTLNKRRWE